MVLTVLATHCACMATIPCIGRVKAHWNSINRNVNLRKECAPCRPTCCNSIDAGYNQLVYPVDIDVGEIAGNG